jgi:hypothetical protein
MTSTRIGQPRFLVCHIKNQIRFVLGHRTQEGRLNVKVYYFSPSAKRGWQSVSEDDWERRRRLERAMKQPTTAEVINLGRFTACWADNSVTATLSEATSPLYARTVH